MSSILDRYQKLGAKFKPNPMQEELFSLLSPAKANPALLLKSPTGSGKTEAVLVPSLTEERRLFLIFPSRSLVEDQVGRCEKYLCKISQGSSKPHSLVIDTGGQSSRIVFANGKRQPDANRHLYDGNVIITTFDKFLYRFFGFGEKNKSYIFPFRIHHSHKRNLFCFDESHSYDKVAFTNFVRLIKSFYKVNLDLVAMTATMPEGYQKELSFLDVVDYTTADRFRSLQDFRPEPYPKIQLEYREANIQDVSREICDYVSRKHQWGTRTIVTIETIEAVVPVYQFFREREAHENILLYHGRLGDKQRKDVYKRLKRIEDDGDGYLLLTTSAIEVGCDLDAHLLVTELCNPDQLIQRAGRCNRKGQIEDAKIVIVGRAIRSFLRTISEETESSYIETLQARSGGSFETDDILKFIRREPHHDYRAEVLFEMLYEYVYEARLENKPLHDRGLVITRSFEPSITLTTNIPESSEHRPENAVSVSLRSCIARARDNESVNPNFKVYQRFYDDYLEGFKFVPLNYGGSVYFKELFIEVPEPYFSEELGYVESPKVFEYANVSGYRQNLIYNTIDENGESRKIWLHYLQDSETPTPEDDAIRDQSEVANDVPVQSVDSVPEVGEQLTLLNFN